MGNLKRLGVIGVGNMGKALLKGVISSQIVKPEEIIIYDINSDLLEKRSEEFKVEKAENNLNLIQNTKFILVAVKPQVIDGVLEEIGAVITDQQLIISIAAGISLDYIEKFIKKEVGIVRVMPNTPALVGAGASALAYNKNVNKKDLDNVKKLLSSIGIVVELEEKHLDAVTGLSGSGPAYVFIIIEALADGGVKMGLPRDVALKLAAHTVLGSAKLFLETNKHPGELKDMVTSPGGTTITALHELEKGKFRGILISAVEAATLKSKAMK
ncbi:MAG: pyrroline-5-carboxylate reductase [Promethearchaeota archaeon]